MTRQDRIWVIDATLRDRGYEYISPPATYKGPLSVHGRNVTVRIAIDDPDFANRPRVELIEAASLGARDIAHVLEGCEVCYADEGGLVLDLYNPGGAVLRVLADAAAALERSFGRGAAREFDAEIAGYWRGGRMLSALPQLTGAKLLPAEIVQMNDDRPAALVLVPEGAWRFEAARRSPCTVLDFDQALLHTPRFPPEDLTGALAFIGSQPGPPVGWRKAVLDAAACGRDVMLRAPNAIMGWRPRLVGPLSAVARSSKGFRPDFRRRLVGLRTGDVLLERQVANETGLEFCVRRNLDGRAGLIGKTIALIGCGTIGGYLAHLVVQHGAGCGAILTLHDRDLLNPGNLGRHMLGFADLGRDKALATAALVSRFHPDVRVEARSGDALEAWETIRGSDLVIDATGDANVATALNEAFLNAGSRPSALLHAWVFGNGVAAQSFLNLRDGRACYRCLRTGFGGRWRHDPLRDPDAPVRRAPAACGEGGYVPFPSDAPMSAATLAARAALDWADGVPGHRLRTTIIDRVHGRDDVKWTTPDALASCEACGR